MMEDKGVGSVTIGCYRLLSLTKRLPKVTKGYGAITDRCYKEERKAAFQGDRASLQVPRQLPNN